MCIYCLYIIYLVCFNESIIFASGFQCSIICFGSVQCLKQYPMLGMYGFQSSILCFGCRQSRGLSGKNLNFRIQYRSSLKNIYSVLLFSEFHMSLISHGSVNLYSYIQLLILLIWFSFVFVYWRYIVFSFALLINLPTIPPFFLRYFLAALCCMFS